MQLRSGNVAPPLGLRHARLARLLLTLSRQRCQSVTRPRRARFAGLPAGAVASSGFAALLAGGAGSGGGARCCLRPG